MVLGFIKRALGQGEVHISDNPFGDKEEAQTVAPVISSINAPIEPELQLQRDEIIDSRGRIAGYRLRPYKTNGAQVHSGEYALLLAEEAVAQLARRRLALIPMKLTDWEQGNFNSLAESGTTFLLETPHQTVEDEIWSGTGSEIKEAGAQFALSNRNLPQPAKNMLPQAKLFLIDFAAYDLPRFEQVIKTLREKLPDLKIAADNISTWAERRYCQSLGIEYCLGGFASTVDEEEQKESIGQSRLVLIEMLNLLRRDADLVDLVAVAKRDPGVSLQVVAMANAPIVGLNQPVTSLDQAIMVLGRENLYRWLTVSLFRAGTSKDQDETLLELALSRARFLELTGKASLTKPQCEELFLVGLLSVMDALLGMPMAKVLEKMHLPQSVQDVLLRSEGAYGRYLMLTLALEKGKTELVQKQVEALALDPALLPVNNLAALRWAEEAMAQNRG